MTEKRSFAGGLVQVGAWGVLLFLVLPALVALPVSVTTKRYLSLPDEGVSLQHYRHLFSSPEWLSGILQSLVIAVCSASLAVLLGTLCAIGLWRISSRISELVRGFLLLPLIIPPIISAMAFYRAWVKLGILDSYTGMIVAHTILATPMVLITVAASLANFDRKLEQASRNLGASLRITVWRVILPSIRPGIIAGGIFAFILSWDEIVVALFIAKFKIVTLPRRMWDGIRDNTDPTVAAAAVVLIVITIAAFSILAFINRYGRRGGAVNDNGQQP